jgi:plastocyanin
MSLFSIGRVSAPVRVSFAAFVTALLALAGVAHFASVAEAAEEMAIEITIKDHKFEPSALKLPADKHIKLSVKNLDGSAEEFESKDLGIEKVIAGNSSATIRLKPLAAGTYIFYGEYHEDTAKGHIEVE